MMPRSDFDVLARSFRVRIENRWTTRGILEDLGKSGRPEAVGLLIESFKTKNMCPDDQDPTCRPVLPREVEPFFSNHGPTIDALRMLVQQNAVTQEDEPRVEIVFGLFESDEEHVSSGSESVLNDDDWAARGLAVERFQALGDGSLTAAVIRSLHNFAIRSWMNDRDQDPLFDKYKDSLRTTGDESECLAWTVDLEEHTPVVMALVDVLKSRGTSISLDVLVQIAAGGVKAFTVWDDQLDALEGAARICREYGGSVGDGRRNATVRLLQAYAQDPRDFVSAPAKAALAQMNDSVADRFGRWIRKTLAKS